VLLVAGPWTQGFILESTLFDGTGSTHDDQVDTVSGGFLMLRPKWRTKMKKFLHL